MRIAETRVPRSGETALHCLPLLQIVATETQHYFSLTGLNYRHQAVLIYVYHLQLSCNCYLHTVSYFMSKLFRVFFLVLFVCPLPAALPCSAGERPYFVAYDQTMEEPGNLEIEAKGLTASPQGGNAFLSGVTEFEYGAKGWWTTEFYLDGQTTANESMLFTGFRWENRFRLLMHEHKVNPVLYVEYEDLSGADKSLLDVVGFDSQYDALVPNREANKERDREIETRLILTFTLLVAFSVRNQGIVL